MERPAPEAHLSPEDPPRWLVLIVVGLCLFLSAWLALAGRSDLLLYGDEYLSLSNLKLSFGEAMGTYDGRGTGVGFLLLQKLSVACLGPVPIAYRLPATLGALGALLIMVPVGRALVGGWAALIATPLLAGASFFVHYSRFGRTYSILVFLSLAFVWALERQRHTPARQTKALVLVALSGGLLPWFHLTTAPSVGLLGLLALWQLRSQPARFKALLVALLAGAALAVCLMLPAWDAMQTFFSNKVGEGRALELGALDVGALVFGTRAGGAVCLALAGLGLLLFIWRRPAGWGLLLLAMLTPLASVLATRPSGAVYAFARYQISALPFVFFLIAWLLVELVRRLGEKPGMYSCLLGWALAGGLFLSGPSVRDRAAFGPFANSNLSLLRLPIFDAPWKGMPAFYSRLAELPEEARILELPEHISRSSLLLRNYWLTHRKDVSMGFMLTHRAERIPGGPHVNVLAGELAAADVDYVVYHKNIQQELTQYWVFAQTKAWDLETDGHLMPYVQGHGNFGSRFEGRKITSAALVELGDPFYEDRFLQVWKVR